MMYIEAYNSKINAIKNITDDRIKLPNNIPLGIYIDEADTLYHWCQDDKKELMAIGLDWTIVEDLEARCGALMQAEANWRHVKILRAEDEQIWVNEATSGNDLRKELLHHFRYAFRKDSSLILKVNDINQRITHKEMIQGLRDLYVLGINNRELLTKIGFDFTMLGLAAKKAEELDAKYKAASWDREDYCDAKKIRNQAFTYLKEAVDLIYEYGRFAFWKNPHRLKGYRSHYLRKKRLKTARRKTVPGPGPVTTPA